MPRTMIGRLLMPITKQPNCQKSVLRSARLARRPEDAELTAAGRRFLRAAVTNSGEAGRYGRRWSPSTGLHRNFEESFSSPLRRGLPRFPNRFSPGGSGKIQGFDWASTAAGEVFEKTFRAICGRVVRDLLSRGSTASTPSLPRTSPRPPRDPSILSNHSKVEVDGLEPTTSCVQSRRSPN